MFAGAWTRRRRDETTCERKSTAHRSEQYVARQLSQRINKGARFFLVHACILVILDRGPQAINGLIIKCIFSVSGRRSGLKKEFPRERSTDERQSKYFADQVKLINTIAFTCLIFESYFSGSNNLTFHCPFLYCLYNPQKPFNVLITHHKKASQCVKEILVELKWTYFKIFSLFSRKRKWKKEDGLSFIDDVVVSSYR